MMLTVLLAVWLMQVADSSDPDERNFGHERVLENILKNYRDAQFLVRPAQTTAAQVGLTLSYIKSFNRNSGRLVAGYMMKQKWLDPRLKWEDLSVSSINLPPDKIWKPDWRVWNSLDHLENIDKSVLPVISNDGTVIWVPLAEFTTTCSPDDEDDSWECNIKIGSWAHTAAQISHHFFNNNTLVDLTFYQPKLNGYDVEAIPGEIVDAHYDCCTAAYQYAVFKLRLRFIEGGVASGSAHYYILPHPYYWATPSMREYNKVRGFYCNRGVGTIG